jgi:lipopolysaccharide heptosyltransferase II
MTVGPGRWRKARRVLAVRLDALGDVVMTTAAFRAIRATLPTVHLALLTSPAAAPLGRLLPEIDETIAYDAPWMKATGLRSDARPDIEIIERLRAERFDGAIIFTVHTQNPLPAALLCHFAGIPLRLAHCRENPYQLLSDWIPEPEPDEPLRHEVRRQLDLVAAAGFEARDEHLSVRVPDTASRRVRDRLGELGIGRIAPWAVIHAGASAPSRRYPAERFAGVAERLARDHGWHIVFTGSADEAPLINAIRASMESPSISLAGSLELDELVALLAVAPLLISNNTGPVHLAAAVGTPVVDLYALTNFQHTPWAVPARVLSHDVPCRGCRKSTCPMGHHLCLRGVSVEEVVAAALELAAEAGIPGAGRTTSPAGAGAVR